MIDLTSNNKGCNYYTITSKEDVEKYIDKKFNYLFFPISYDFEVIYSSPNSTIIEAIGLGDNDVAQEKTKGGLKNKCLSKAKTSFPGEIVIRTDGIFICDI